MITAFVVYGFAQVDWSAGGTNTYLPDISKVDFSVFFNNTYINMFMMLNMVLGLMLLDRYLSKKRESLRKSLGH